MSAFQEAERKKGKDKSYVIPNNFCLHLSGQNEAHIATSSCRGTEKPGILSWHTAFLNKIGILLPRKKRMVGNNISARIAKNYILSAIFFLILILIS